MCGEKTETKFIQEGFVFPDRSCSKPSWDNLLCFAGFGSRTYCQARFRDDSHGFVWRSSKTIRNEHTMFAKNIFAREKNITTSEIILNQFKSNSKSIIFNENMFIQMKLPVSRGNVQAYAGGAVVAKRCNANHE